jgi:hypothetical protein
MAQMVRKQVYIEPRHEAILKRLARVWGVTEAEIIRRAIDNEESAAPSAIYDLTAWEQEKAFIVEWVAAGPLPGSRQWRREDAYEERLSRYGR